MAEKSKIEWTTSTWNPVTGCTKVSAGCKNCYAERLFKRVYSKDTVVFAGSEKGGPVERPREFTDVKLHPGRLDWPLRRRQPLKIFVNSMSDLFHEDVPDEFIDQVFAVMALAQQHTFQILTKRPDGMWRWTQGIEGMAGEAARDAMIEGNAQRIYAEKNPGDDPSLWLAVHQPIPNVWLGVSVEDQKTADERIPLLLQTPAAVRFVSYEPALGLVDFGLYLTRNMFPWKDPLPGLDWLIAGGESGPGARPSHPNWFRQARDQCVAAGVPFFFKQWGEWAPVLLERDDEFMASTAFDHPRGGRVTGEIATPFIFTDATKHYFVRVGKKAAGRLLDGREWSEFPAVKNG